MDNQLLNNETLKVKSAIALALSGIGVIILLMSVVYVPVGSRGIGTRFGAITGQVRGEGMHFKAPIISGNKNIEIRVQKIEVDASAASKDLQNVTSKIAVNYALQENKLISLYQGVGQEYDSRLLQPAIQESVKATTAKYTAEELITKRADVSDQILRELKTRLSEYGLTITDLNILDFDFSISFNESIERKVTAQQDALAAENKLKQIEFEAEQAVASAKGKAEAQKIEGEALRANPEVLQLRAIEKWNGTMPTYWGGGNLPIINIK